jgi:serine/threonine-protein kinase RsbW
VSASVPSPFHAAWPAVADSVTDARRAVVSYLHATETKDPPLRDIALAVSEAVTNVIHHAYVGEDAGDVRVGLEFTEHELELVVEDDGRGLVPRVDSPGAGLGLPIIASIADRLDTRTRPGRGTRLCMFFCREPEAAALN